MVIPDLLMLDTSPITVIVHPADKELPPLTLDLGFGEKLSEKVWIYCRDSYTKCHAARYCSYGTWVDDAGLELKLKVTHWIEIPKNL